MISVLLRGVIKDNIKNLLFWILILVVLLTICVAVDSAEEINISNANHTNVSANDTYVNLQSNTTSNITVTARDTVHQMYPTVSMYAKPSCGCQYSYKYWYYREFVNYCPNCHHYNVLVKNPKGTFEREWTCKRCSSDFCGVCGKEKYSWSKVYLRRA